MWYFKTVTNKVTNERYQKDKREMNEVFYRLATDAVTKLCELDCVKSRDVQEPEHRSAAVLDLHNLVTKRSKIMMVVNDGRT